MDSVHWVLWDGACDFCAWSIAWLRWHDTQGRFRIVPFQSAPPELLQRVSPNALRRGVLFIGEQLGYGWLTRPLSLPPMIWIVEGVYWTVARLRGKLSRWLRLSETECPQ
jgi:predicted DCC family thiol-disulfide oxidoreductase YuxK